MKVSKKMSAPLSPAIAYAHVDQSGPHSFNLYLEIYNRDLTAISTSIVAATSVVPFQNLSLSEEGGVLNVYWAETAPDLSVVFHKASYSLTGTFLNQTEIEDTPTHSGLAQHDSLTLSDGTVIAADARALSNSYVWLELTIGEQNIIRVSTLSGGLNVFIWNVSLSYARDGLHLFWSERAAASSSAIEQEALYSLDGQLLSIRTIASIPGSIFGALSGDAISIASPLSVAFDDQLVEGADAALTIVASAASANSYDITLTFASDTVDVSEIAQLPSTVTMPANQTTVTVPFHIKQNAKASTDPAIFHIGLTSAVGAATATGNIKEFISRPLVFTKPGDEFTFSKANNRMEASGDVAISRIEAPNTSLLRIADATAYYSDREFGLSSMHGMVYAAVSGLERPLFQGSFVLPYATASTMSLTESDVPANAFQLAGLDIHYKALSVLPEVIGADVVFSLPFTLGSLNIDTSLFKPLLVNQSGLIFDSTGVSVGFTTEVSLRDSPELLIFGVFTAKVNNIALSYQQSTDILKFQGKLSVTNLLALTIESATIDISGSNFIQFQAGKADFSGTLTIQAVKATDPLHTGFGLESLSLSLNTIAKTLSGTAAIVMPFGGRSPTGSATLEGSWTNGPTITKIGLGFDGLQLALGSTPIFWQSASIELKNFFDPAQATEYTGSLGFSFGPRVQGAAAATLDVTGTGSKAKLTGTTVDLKVLPYSAIDVGTFGTGLFRDLQHLFPVIEFKGTSVVDFDFAKQTFLDYRFNGQINFFGNFISESISRSFVADKDLNFTFSGKTMVNLSIPLLDKFIAVGGSVEVPYQVVYKNNDTFEDDYVAVWVTVAAGVGPLVANFTVSAKLFFDGHYQTNLGKPPTATVHSPALDGSGQAAAQIASPDWLLLNVAWENKAVGPIGIRVINPQGHAFGEAEFSSNAIAVVDQLTTLFSKTVVVFNPGPSDGWRIELVDTIGLGVLTTRGALPGGLVNLESVDIVQVSPGGTVSLNYSASAPLGASLEFFADQDDQSFNGMSLGLPIIADEGSGNWTGNLNLSAGVWRVYGTLSDGIGVPVRVYASEALVVANDGVLSIGNPVSISSGILAQAEGTVTFSAFIFTISLAHAANTTETVAWSVAQTGEHPASASDFADNAFSGGVVTFAAGETTKTIRLDIAADTLVETDEGFAVMLSNPSANVVLGTATAFGTIQNDDVSTVSISALSAVKAEGNGGSTAFTFTVSLDQAAASSQSIDWTVAGSNAHPAGASDFTGGVLPSGTLSFATGETSKAITVLAASDTTVEFDEFFTVTLANPSAGLVLGAATATGDIQNEDRAHISVTPLSAVKAEGNSGTTAFTFTVSLDQPSVFGTQTADWSVSGTGTNQANAADFSGAFPSGIMSFAQGETSKIITVLVGGDTAMEFNEDFAVTLSNLSFGLAAGTAIASGTIQNDDAANPVGSSLVSDLGGSAGFGEYALPPGDDSPSVQVDVSSIFSGGIALFGTLYPSLFLNYNGSVTFGTALTAFDPNAISSASSIPIIAPLWADVDTRGGITAATVGGTSTGSNTIWYDLDTVNRVFTATWDDVGYYAKHTDQLNAFQLRLIAVGTSGDFDIEFRYEDINWTTGDASGGLNGRGGSVARAGYSSGGGQYQELFQSGDQTGMLNLEDTSNIGIPGLYVFDVRNGVVDVSQVSIAAQSAERLEGNSGSAPFSFTVTRSGNLSDVQSVAWSASGSGGNPASATDFTGGLLPSGTLTFAAGETSKTVMVSVSGDNTVEFDESFTVTLSNPTGGMTLGTATASGTIQNDDASVSITALSSAQAEGNSGTTAFTFTVTLSGDTSIAHTVSYGVTGSGANPANAADFSGGALPSGIVTFAVGETTKTVTVNVAGDATVEADEGFTVTLFAPTGGATIGTGSAIGIIGNDDSLANSQISITGASADEAEGNAGTTPFTFTVTRTGDASTSQSVNWTVTGGVGSNVDAADFAGNMLPAGSVTFAPGETSKTLTVNVQGDTSLESDELFLVTLSSPNGGATLGTASAVGTVRNDDSIVSSQFSFSGVRNADNAEGDAGPQPFTFEVARTGDSSTTQSVSWGVFRGTVDAADFVGNSLPNGILSFAPGEISKTIIVSVQGDTTQESDDTFFVGLSAPTGGATLGTNDFTSAIIRTDDAPFLADAIVSGLALDSTSIPWGGSVAMSFRLKNLGPATAEIFESSIYLSADSTITTSDQYLRYGGSTPGRLNAGDTSDILDVFGQRVDLPRVAPGTYWLGALADPDNRLVEANEDNNGAAVQITVLAISAISINALSAVRTEGNSGWTLFTFTVSRTGDSSTIQSVNWAVAGSGDTPANAPDFVGSVLPTGTVSFGTGETTKTVALNVIGDTAGEPDEGFTVTLSTPTGGATLGAVSATGVILDDDKSVVQIASGPGSKTEGTGGTTVFDWTVTLDRAGVTSQTVAWAVTGNSQHAVNGADLVGGALPSGILTFAPGETSKTVGVSVAGDSFAEFDEGLILTLSNPSSGLNLGTAALAATILNDDLAPVVAHNDAYIVTSWVEVFNHVPVHGPGVLFNDENALEATLLTSPTHASGRIGGSNTLVAGFSFESSGAFSYTPVSGFSGIDSFTYRSSNGSSSADAQVVIYVVPTQGATSPTLNLLALNAEEQIAATYIAFFGRGADASGFDFWVGQFRANLPTQGGAALFANIASSFGVSDEAEGLYPFLVNPFAASDPQISAFIDSVYLNMFNRGSDAAGLAYWTGQTKATLAAGQFVGSILVNIMSGAQNTADGQDISTLMGKVAVSLDYVQQQTLHGTHWNGAADTSAATNLLHGITADPATVLAGIKNADTLIVNHV